MKKALVFCIAIFVAKAYGQKYSTPFEKSNGKQTATYFEAVNFYKNLDKNFNTILIKQFDTTDAGYPLHLVLYNANANFNIANCKKNNQIVVLINNGIHPGEPDGVDACMMLLRDLATSKIKTPKNIVIAIIPMYNIGGSINRNKFSRVNQNGPLEYGFRGNAQNLDLNRDFIKADSKEAKCFSTIFQYLKPEIFIDNHVSDGADYQHTMTLLTTQHNKLGGAIGNFLHNSFEPEIYAKMKEKNWSICPYVNFEKANADSGWQAFYDPPRYSSGYASLFNTISFVPETHMLKPFADRVKSTYDLMDVIINTASTYSNKIIEHKTASNIAIKNQKNFPLSWKIDTTKFEEILFEGYQPESRISKVTGLNSLYYNHNKPFTKKVKFYNFFTAEKFVTKPKAYIIKQGWYSVVQLLKLNGIYAKQLKNDTTINVTTYKIENYKTVTRPYEKHYKHYDVQINKTTESIKFYAGDYIVYTGENTDRFLIETLEPEGDDSYFAWNFFDAILQQKEGYTDYRWEDLAYEFLNNNLAIKQKFEDRKKTDADFAKSASAQLNFIYKNSPYYEPEHLRYPVFRVEF